MPNPIKGEALLALPDGQKFVLVLDKAALVEAAYAHTGKPKLRKLFADMKPEIGEDGKPLLDEDGDPVKDVLPATTAMLWGALIRHQPDITMDEARIILINNEGPVSAALQEAMESGFGSEIKAAEDGDSPNPPGTKSGTGRRSGASGAKRA